MTTMIVVATNPERGVYLDHFFENVPSYYRDYIYVASTWGMEIGAIQDAMNTFRDTTVQHFALLQDSMRVNNWGQFMTDISLFDSAYIIPRPSCYAMVYDTELLDQMSLPHVGQDKEMAIWFETVFTDTYEAMFRSEFQTDMPVLYPEMTDANALYKQRFYDHLPESRLHLRSDCGTLSKFKATYR